MVTDPPYGIELDSEWCDRAGLNKHGPAEASYMKQRTEGHTNTSISSDTRADWFEAFALVPSLQVAYVWHASKFTSEVLAGLLITAYGSRFLAQEIRHEGPTFLPDGNHFLYLRVSSVAASSGLYVGSLDAGAEEQSSGRVLATESAASYEPPADREPGRLLFVREGALLAQSFDLGRLQLAGEPELAAEAVGIVGSRGLFSASTNGVLIYRAGETQNLQLTWFDRRGKVLGTAGEPGRYFNLSLSPNGTTAAKGNGRQTLPGWSLDRLFFE
jgi:hypothetical protein